MQKIIFYQKNNDNIKTQEKFKDLKLYNTKPILKYYKGRHFALHEYQSIYFEVPKSACSSLILKCADMIKLKIDRKSIHCQENKNKIPIIDFKMVDSEYKDYYKFTFVRNPWDRLVSCYTNKIKQDANFNTSNFKNGVSTAFLKYDVFKSGMSFTDFVIAICEIPDEKADAHILSQHQFVINNQGVIFMDFIGKFETLQNDFNQLCHKLNIYNKELPHKNKSRQKKHYSDFFTSEIEKKVRERYAIDIELFDYKFTNN